MSQLGQMEPFVPVQEITEPLAIKDSGNIQRFNEAAERNLGDLRGLSLDINTDLVPKLNALVALLNQQLPYINTVADADAEIHTNANNIDSINTLATHMTALLAVNLQLTEVQAVSDNMASIIAVSGQGTEIAAVAANMPAVLAAPDAATAANASAQAAAASATQSETAAATAGQHAQDAGQSAGQAATSASDAGDSASDAAQSSSKAREWAEKAEDTPVETGKYSALHWAEKSRNAALTALGGIPLIEAGDDGKALVADGETLAWVKGPSFTATPAAGAVPKADASGKIAAGWIPPVAPAAHHTSHEPGGNDALTRFSGVLTEKVQNLGVISGAVTINLASGHYVVATVGGAVTINVSGAEPGVCTAVMLELDNAGSTAVTWGMTPTWAGGVAPSLTASGKDYVGLCSRGEGWAGVLVSSDAK